MIHFILGERSLYFLEIEMVKTKKPNGQKKPTNSKQETAPKNNGNINLNPSLNHQKNTTKPTKSKDKNVSSHSKTPEPSFSEPFELPLCGCCSNSQRIIDSVLDAMKIQGTAQQENFYLVLKELRSLIFEMGECCYPPLHGSRPSRTGSTDDESSSSTGKFYGDLREQKNNFVPPPFIPSSNNNNNGPSIEALLTKQ